MTPIPNQEDTISMTSGATHAEGMENVQSQASFVQAKRLE